jgi:hypothetical protein
MTRREVSPFVDAVRAGARRRDKLAAAEYELGIIGRLIVTHGLELAALERATSIPRTTLRRARDRYIENTR